MARARSETRLVTVVTPTDPPARRPDRLIVEEPLTIQLDDVVVATTMRTPGDDFELAVGYCVTEGLLAGAPVRDVRYCATGSAVATEFNVVTVGSGGLAPTATPRLTVTTSSCGWCGDTHLAELADRLSPLPPTDPMPIELLARLPELVAPRQHLFRATGAAHAAAVFDADGTVGTVREDVGRHNAVDKVVGALALAGDLPAVGRGLFVSSRGSVEIVSKAWAAGFATVVCVSAPTVLAVETAHRAGITLAGFVRDGRCNVYAPERLPT